MPISEQGKAYNQLAGDVVVDEVTIGDYEFFLSKSGMVKNLYQIGMQRAGQDAFDLKQQMSRQPAGMGRGTLTELRTLLNRWLTEYGTLVFASMNGEKTAAYTKLIGHLGFQIGKRSIMGHEFPTIVAPSAKAAKAERKAR